MDPLDQQPTWKQWIQRLIASMSLVAALTAALLAIAPLLMGHPNWLQILFTFALVLVFAILHSLTAALPDPALRTALSAVLDKLETILQQLTNVSSRLGSVEQRMLTARSSIADKDTTHGTIPPQSQGYPYNS